MEKGSQGLPDYIDFVFDLNEHFIYAEYSGTSRLTMTFRPVSKDDVPER